MPLRSLLPAVATLALLGATIAGTQLADNAQATRPATPAITAGPAPVSLTANPAPSPGVTAACPPPEERYQVVICPGAGAAGDPVTLAGRDCHTPGGPAIIYFGRNKPSGVPGGLYGARELGRFDVAADGTFSATVRVPHELRPIQNTGGGPVTAGTYEIYSKPTHCATNFRVTAPLAASVRPSALGRYFDNPPEYPGLQWMRNGAPAVRGYELTTAAGPGHCEWEAATFLTIGWPIGTVSRNAIEARQYIRDPRGVVPTNYLQNELELFGRLPADARPTGYRYEDLEIYVSPSDQDWAIYVVGPAGVERWPRSDPMTLCI